MESSYLTVDFFRRLPQEVDNGGNPASSTVDRYSEMHFRRIGSNVFSYVGMVSETLKSTIPKAVVHCQVREAKHSLLNHFYTLIGRKEGKQLSQLLDEDPTLMERRQQCAKRLELYKAARDEPLQLAIQTLDGGRVLFPGRLYFLTDFYSQHACLKCQVFRELSVAIAAFCPNFTSACSSSASASASASLLVSLVKRKKENRREREKKNNEKGNKIIIQDSGLEADYKAPVPRRPAQKKSRCWATGIESVGLGYGHHEDWKEDRIHKP
ncbi:DYNAMIN [Salix viminalis]|uniref:DYNAMIN n=1 Tax=Salix viminalis TaxID=40686 RepID=A0A9Q0UH50_SALVM|nr:DYNAMIN [Salix viminalis]